MSGVKDGNTKNRLKQYIQSDSYRHIISFCCFKKVKNSTKKWQDKFVLTFSKSLIYFVSFINKLKKRYLSRRTPSLMYFAKCRMGKRNNK